MNERLNVSMGMYPEMLQEQQAEMHMSWETHPFAMARHIGPIRNFRLTSNQPSLGKIPEVPHQVDELEASYTQERDMLLKDRFVIIGASGRNKHGKGSLLMDKKNLFEQDEVIRNKATDEGFRLEIISVPFAHAIEAAKLAQIGLIDPRLNPATYSFEDTRNGSWFQWHLIDKHALPKHAKTTKEVTQALKEQQKAVVILVEASTPLVYPASSTVPVEVYGIGHIIDNPIQGQIMQDLGNSTLYNLARDSRTRENTFLYFIQKNIGMRNESVSNKIRVDLNSDKPNSKKTFSGEIKVMVRMPNGQRVNIRTLRPEQQRKLTTLLRKSMAPPAAISKLDLGLDILEEALYLKGMIHTKSDAGYFELIRAELEMGSTHFKVVDNPPYKGEKEYDMDYLINNLVIQGHPGLLEEAA